MVSTLQSILVAGVSFLTVLRFTGYLLGFLLLSVAAAIGSIWVALAFFLRLTHNLNEMTEIQRNNMAVAISLGVTIVAMSIFLADGVSTLLNALIPYSEFLPSEVLGG
jgi:uncharacterized membrane protein YjfL (UPF0719 family)